MTETVNMDIIQILKDSRHENEWTQTTVAEKTGLLQSHITQWETRKYSPSLKNVIKWASAFDYNVILVKRNRTKKLEKDHDQA